MDFFFKCFFVICQINLLKMLLIRWVDLTIDLNPNAESIVKTPCCHSFMENKKLKQQLNDLLGKKITQCLINPLGIPL